jgi:hypothetical protein
MPIDITSWSGFISEFKLPVSMSLIGAMIGHFRKNGVINMPTVSISYVPGPVLENPQGFWQHIGRGLYLIVDCILYLFGVHIKRSGSRDIQERYGVYIDLGFFGDLLVGIGTGILAKTALEMADVNNDFALVSGSLLAGFAGMSYIIRKQETEEDAWFNEALKNKPPGDVESGQPLEDGNLPTELPSERQAAAAQESEYLEHTKS